jgi:vitamin-K-epoxide reductase (warfarin-sensitive)
MRFLIALFALAGIIDSCLALRIHNQDPTVAPPCAVTEKWDCGRVNHSRYSVFPPEDLFEDPGSKKIHIPVALLGILGYSAILVLALAKQYTLTLLATLGGFGFAAYLSYLEQYKIEKWCIYCVWSQVFIACALVCTILALALKARDKRKFEQAAVRLAQ